MGLFISTLNFLFQGLKVRGKLERKKYINVDELIDAHFREYSFDEHPCKETFRKALTILGGKPANIIETGSSAWGTNSTLLLDSYVNSFGGSLHSVDIRINPLLKLKNNVSSRTKLYVSDSVKFIENYKGNESINFVYLDSFDVDWNNPIPSMIHGLKEFFALIPNINTDKGCLILIDDTPSIRAMEQNLKHYFDRYDEFFKKFNLTPGKGSLIVALIDKIYPIHEIIENDYQVLIKIKS